MERSSCIVPRMETAEIWGFIDNGPINILAICVLIAIKLGKMLLRLTLLTVSKGLPRLIKAFYYLVPTLSGAIIEIGTCTTL